MVHSESRISAGNTRQHQGLPVVRFLAFSLVGLAVFRVIDHICKLHGLHFRIEFLTIRTLLLPFLAMPVDGEPGTNVPSRPLGKVAWLWFSMVMLVACLQIFGADPLHSDNLLHAPFDLLSITLLFLWVVHPAYEGIYWWITKGSRP